jgi:hypothetical protein
MRKCDSWLCRSTEDDPTYEVRESSVRGAAIHRLCREHTVEFMATHPGSILITGRRGGRA